MKKIVFTLLVIAGIRSWTALARTDFGPSTSAPPRSPNPKPQNPKTPAIYIQILNYANVLQMDA